MSLKVNISGLKKKKKREKQNARCQTQTCNPNRTIVVLNIINGNFGLVKSWQTSPMPIRARVLFVSFWFHSKPHTKTQLERPKRPAQLDNQLNTKGETYKILIWYIIVKWCVCVSVSHTLILSWKLIERPHFVGVKWNWGED